jgi:hypothetical protein
MKEREWKAAMPPQSAPREKPNHQRLWKQLHQSGPADCETPTMIILVKTVSCAPTAHHMNGYLRSKRQTKHAYDNHETNEEC